MRKTLACLALALFIAGLPEASSASSYVSGYPEPRPVVEISFNTMDDELNPLPGADVIVSQSGVDTVVTDGGGFAELSAGAVRWGTMQVSIEHAATLRQTIDLVVPFRFDHFTLVYAVPTWRTETVFLDGDTLRSSNSLDVFMTAGGPAVPFSFDYANLQSHETVSAYVLGPVSDDAHAALVIRPDQTAYVDGLTILVDTEAHYGIGVPATVTAVNEFGDPYPGMTLTSATDLPGYPTAFSVSGTFLIDDPVVFLLEGVPITMPESPEEEVQLEHGEGGVIAEYGLWDPNESSLILAAPCENLPADETNPDSEICTNPFTFAPQAHLLGCIANCGGQSARSGKFGGKVTGQVGVKVGLEAKGEGGGASLSVSASGSVSGWFEENYEVPPGKQRCWYLCTRETSWYCCDWLCRWFDFPPKVMSVYAVGTDVVDTDCK